MLPFIHILISRNLTVVFPKKKLYFATAVLLVISSAMIYNFYVSDVKSDWLSATNTIRGSIRPDDILVYPGGDNIAPFLYYYPEKPFDYSSMPMEIYDYSSMELYDESKVRISYDLTDETLFEMKQKAEEKGGGIWAVFYYRQSYRKYFNDFAGQNLKLEFEKEFDDKGQLVVRYYSLS